MKKETKEKLQKAKQYCDDNDKSTEFMLQYMQDHAGVDLDCVLNYLESKKNEVKPKGYLFGMTHAMPTACLLNDDGEIVKSHGGSDYHDAVYWFNHFKKGDGYDVEVIDQDLVHKVFYKGASIDILMEKHPEFAKILEKNKQENEVNG